MKMRPFLSPFAASLAMAAVGHVAAAEQPSIVIVHGAFADGSDWAKVIALLQAKGVQVTAVQNGVEALASDVATTRCVVDNQKGRVSWSATPGVAPSSQMQAGPTRSLP